MALLALVLNLPCGNAAPASTPTLSYFQRSGLVYQWRLWQPGQQQAALFLESRSQPMNVFWVTGAERVYYTVEGKVFRARIDRLPGQPEQVAALPTDAGEIRALWLERGTRRLRIAAMHAVAPRDILTQGGLRYRLTDGHSIAGMSVPSWGLPFVCTVLELSDDGRSWKVLTQRATKDLAGETPGVSVVDDLRHELGTSNDRLLEAYTCSAGQCRNDVAADLIKLASAQAHHQFSADASLLPADAGQAAIIFETGTGDQLHMTPPMVLITADNRAMRLPVDGRQQLGVAIRQSQLLLADEATGARPVVVDTRTGQVQFQANGWAASWVP